jgi:hypothetical protein
VLGEEGYQVSKSTPPRGGLGATSTAGNGITEDYQIGDGRMAAGSDALRLDLIKREEGGVKEGREEKGKV